MTDRWDDEIDQALGELRADVPAMDQRAFAAGRARLVVAIGAPSMAAPVREPDETATITLPPDLRRRSPPLRRATPWLAVAAAVAVVAVGAVAFLPGDTAPPGGPVGTAAPSASSSAEPSVDGRPGEALPPMPDQPLNTAGELADDVRDVELRPGQVRYVRSARTQAVGDAGPGGTATEDLWIPYDRESDWLVRNAASGEIQARNEEDFVEQRAKGGQFERGALWSQDPQTVAGLPRDPAGLYEWLRSETTGTSETVTAAQEAIGTVISMLADVTGTVPVDLQAALLRTLGYLPGLTVTPDARATDGRPAVAVGHAVDDGLYRNEILFDPATAHVIEWRNVANKPFEGFERDQAFTTDLRTEAVVSRLGQRP